MVDIGLWLKLVSPVAKFLAKRASGDEGAVLADVAFKFADHRFKDTLQREDAEDHFKGLARGFVQELAPGFQKAIEQGGVSIEDVVGKVAAALDKDVAPKWFVEHRMLHQPMLDELLEKNPPGKWGDLNSKERQLYEEILDRCVGYLIQVSAELPNLKSHVYAELLQQVASIRGDLKRMFERYDRIDAQADDSYEARYRQAVCGHFDYMELFGADITPESRRHPLSVAYVSLNLHAETDEDDEDADFSLPFDEVLERISSDSRRLLVRGEAGSGKSTLSRWATLQAAGPVDNDDQAQWKSYVPFLIRLRDFQHGELPPAQELPKHVAKDVGDPPTEWITDILQNGKALILLDGVDEVPTEKRDDVLTRVRSIIEAWPDNFYLVSTRPAAVPEGWLAAENFREATINDMAPSGRGEFISRWHNAVAEQLVRTSRQSDDDLKQLATDLKAKLRETPDIARLAVNPLLCGMICALHRDYGEQLPHTPVELCEKLCESLLNRHELSKLPLDGFPQVYRRLGYRQRRGIVQEIAHFMVKNGQSSILLDEAQSCITTALMRFDNFDESDMPTVTQALVEQSGLLREPKPGWLDFIHNTLKEFLAGERFAQLNDWGLLADRALDPAWQPAILFAAQTDHPTFANRLVERLLNPGLFGTAVNVASGYLGGTDALRARQLFAVRCGTAALNLDQSLREKRDDILSGTTRPKSLGEARAFAALGEFALPFLEYDPKMKVAEATACIQTLTLIDTPQARDLLSVYVEDSRKRVKYAFLETMEPSAAEFLREFVERLRGTDGSCGWARSFLRYDPWSRLSTEEQSMCSKWMIGVKPFRNALSLDLNETWISDLRPIAQFTELRRLELSGTKIHDLSPLAGLTALQHLDLFSTAITELKPLTSLFGLETLILDRTNVSDVRPLAPLVNLCELSLSGTTVSDVTALASLTNLETLDLSNTQVNDVSPLCTLKNLWQLNLSGTQVSDISALAGIGGLEVLGLPGFGKS